MVEIHLPCRRRASGSPLRVAGPQRLCKRQPLVRPNALAACLTRDQAHRFFREALDRFDHTLILDDEERQLLLDRIKRLLRDLGLKSWIALRLLLIWAPRADLNQEFRQARYVLLKSAEEVCKVRARKGGPGHAPLGLP